MSGPVSDALAALPILFRSAIPVRLVTSHIPDVDNTLADDLSRDRLPCFLSKAPEMERHPSPIPTSLPTLLLEGGNWMCPRWTKEFASIFREG